MWSRFNYWPFRISTPVSEVNKRGRLQNFLNNLLPKGKHVKFSVELNKLCHTSLWIWSEVEDRLGAAVWSVPIRIDAGKGARWILWLSRTPSVQTFEAGMELVVG